MKKALTVLAVLVFLLGAADGWARSEEATRRNNLGTELLRQERMEEAIAAFRMALELDPDYATARLNLGYTYDRQGQIEEAMAEYRKVTELDPGNLLAHNNLGVLHDKRGSYDEAIAEFETVLRLDPSHAVALKNLENAKRNKGIMQERQERLAQARKEAEANPTDPSASFNLARLYAASGEKDQAIEWLARALALGLTEFALLKDDPAFKTLRDDPRFMQFLERR